ncbi:zinc transporter ZIP8 [Platysternon megacephalum]|uniref:Zinc transporter ZIP8 n=1 Tax=Platysternon megacephalum TaxID=55544 RepID=A0A4D9F029_9SAUR|nr:zinc transporter ZIP8 [Platysternon megacephalum]
MSDWATAPGGFRLALAGGSRSYCGAMEAAGLEPRQRGREPEPTAANGDCSRPLSLSGQSYWLDVWLFVLFDLALLVFVYLLP